MKSERKQTTNAFGLSLDRENLSDLVGNSHRRAYERHFEGYTQRRLGSEKDADGNPTGKLVRVYTGRRYLQEHSDRAALWLRVCYVALYVAAAAAAVYASMLNTASNYSWYVLLSLLVCAYFFVRVFLTLLAYIPSGRELTIYEYREGAARLPRFSGFAALSMVLPLISGGVCLLIRGEASGLEALRAALLGFSAVSLYMIGRIESGVKYTLIPGEPAPETEAEEKS